jgi:hypothetical protein
MPGYHILLLAAIPCVEDPYEHVMWLVDAVDTRKTNLMMHLLTGATNAI